MSLIAMKNWTCARTIGSLKIFCSGVVRAHGHHGPAQRRAEPASSSHLRLCALAEVLTASRSDAISFLRSICELQRARQPCWCVLFPCLYPTALAFNKLASPSPCLERCAVHHPTPAAAIHALARSTSKTPASTGSLEPLIGRLVAAAGITIVEALGEYRDGGLTPATRTRGGDLIAQLVGLYQFAIVDFDFDNVARVHGTAALCAADVSPSTADRLVDEVLRLLHKVMRAAVN